MPRRIIQFITILVATTVVAAAETLHGRVVGISDGDTLTVLDSSKQQHKVRLQGIDAPEKAQAYGQVSRQQLADLVHGRDVTLDCNKTDRYKRRVCVVYRDGEDINLAQIRAGMSWWYRAYSGEQTAEQRKAYEEAEEAARSAGQGLWRDREPVAPWEWRRERRRKV